MKLVCYFESMNRAVSLAESPDALLMEFLSLGVGDGAAARQRFVPFEQVWGFQPDSGGRPLR
jgi:hypothetical protein